MSTPTPASSDDATPSFADLGLPPAILGALTDLGYETPSPIQAQTIPHLLAQRDVLGQAQTGTGKTAAFALPLLAHIDIARAQPQALILAPTRELAIQVAEAVQSYATHLSGLRVLPIYGGQSYHPQLAALRRGVHVVVGTPGRVIDHLERSSLSLDALHTLVLDEADEMLRMGFIDDVETILQKTPAEKQVALFSATMPQQIRRIAQTYLREPAEVTIAAKTRTATTVNQRCLVLPVHAKLDALTRILEVEPFDAMIIFARTKLATEELAEKLSARGFSAAALNGDIAQQQRERTVNKLKDGGLDIIVATDVAARGLDVERISHVLNYDVPTDPESYVHRIGRTGRAGRSGEAILFISPRERRLLSMIERTTRKHIEQMELPTEADVQSKRDARFSARVTEVLAQPTKLTAPRRIINQLVQSASLEDIAAALVVLAQQTTGNSAHAAEPIQHSRAASEARQAHPARNERPFERSARTERSERPERFERSERPERARAPGESLKNVFLEQAPRLPFERSPTPSGSHDERPAARTRRARSNAAEGMETYRIEVGFDHGVQPKNIVGAIANEAGLDSQFIGHIDIHGDHSFIDLPEGMPKAIFTHLKKVWVSGHKLNISKTSGGDEGQGFAASPSRPRAPSGGDFKPVGKPRKSSIGAADKGKPRR
ncbi:DEAD/DEAH box helicase [Sinimarinibacterium sp. NLF-5-8]|uniref:DEAD/DEAH box helicase n=1 Tax=Sinimarinibacterium sp. NLF-5-8 TaxID=2698684 RepID=UPI00137BBAB0|nr:DEAD/DEAH box helicase [Sinimarinibacterium sp. NLF-5-8]QHS11212.1 DEAD/DEAH box helicase [Sinimarinibacterium sp. NLF-5-8]